MATRAPAARHAPAIGPGAARRRPGRGPGGAGQPAGQRRFLHGHGRRRRPRLPGARRPAGPRVPPGGLTEGLPTGPLPELDAIERLVNVAARWGAVDVLAEIDGPD